MDVNSPEWDCAGCPPPLFHLPPPPRPPWLDDLEGEDCADTPSLHERLSQLETCDNLLIFKSSSEWEETFHGVAVVVVCALVLVLAAVAGACLCFR